MWTKILGWVMTAISVIPSLAADVERLWAGVPQSGSQKWISVEQALSGSISDVANEVAKLSPAGTTANEISDAVAIFSKDVNDAFVKLANDLKLFPHAGQPATNAAPPPAVTVKQ